MQFTRYLSDGNSVIQERIRLPLQPVAPKLSIEQDVPIEADGFHGDALDRARHASRSRVLAGIDQLLRNAATAA